MIDFPKDLNVLDIDPQTQEQELVELFQDKTKKKLYSAQSERITLSVLNMVLTTVKMQFNEAIKNCLLPYAKGIWLDIIGALFRVPRLLAQPARTTLKFKLYQPFSINKTILKGTQVETSDGDYVFVTDETIVISAGQTTGIVGATSLKGGALLNQYGTGDITGLLDQLAFVESVENTTTASGGADDEEDDHYKNRLYLAPDGWTNAGPTGAYKFWAISAHKDILDVSVITPVFPASVKINSVEYTENNGIIDIDGVKATVDYYRSKIIFPAPVSVDEVTIPAANKVYVYVLAKDGADEELILDLAAQALNKEEIRPTTDFVSVYRAITENFTLKNIEIVAANDAPSDLEQTVTTVLEAYFLQLRSKLNQAVVPSEIIKIIQEIQGVYKVDLPTSFVYKAAMPDKIYIGSIEAIKITGGVK